MKLWKYLCHAKQHIFICSKNDYDNNCSTSDRCWFCYDFRIITTIIFYHLNYDNHTSLTRTVHCRAKQTQLLYVNKSFSACQPTKHLKGQWRKSVMKNEHFLKLCPEGQLGGKWQKNVFGTKNEHFLKLSQERASYHIFAICFKNFLRHPKNLPAQTVSCPTIQSRPAVYRAA